MHAVRAHRSVHLQYSQPSEAELGWRSHNVLMHERVANKLVPSANRVATTRRLKAGPKKSTLRQLEHPLSSGFAVMGDDESGYWLPKTHPTDSSYELYQTLEIS